MPSAKNRRAKRISNKPQNRLRRIKREAHKMEKKLVKLLRLHKEKRLTKNQTKKERREDGSVKKELPLNQPRYQGIKEGEKKHLRLKTHITNLKKKLQDLQNG